MPMMNPTRKISLFASLIFAVSVSAQEKDLGTETVTVVRSYAPAVSDAFKIKTLPTLNDSIVGRKIPVQYSISSVPVASTFTPAKGRAAAVQRSEPEKIYNTYTALGLGNYNNALADFYTSLDFDRGKQLLDIGLNHFPHGAKSKGLPWIPIFTTRAWTLPIRAGTGIGTGTSERGLSTGGITGTGFRKR